MRASNVKLLQRLAWLALFNAAAIPSFAQEECEVPDCAGVALSASYAGDLRRNTTGGVATGTAYDHMLTLGADWSTDNLFGDTHVTGSASVMYMGGAGISGDYVGDLQGLNNIEADQGWHLYELWTEFSFGGNSHTTLRTGVLDLNAEFDAPETLGQFVSPPHGIGTDLSQTGSAGPSIWPLTGLGVRAAGSWDNGLQWRFGVYDGAPGTSDGHGFTNLRVSSEEGVIGIGELAYSSERVHKISLGLWNYSAKFDRIDANLVPDAQPQHGNNGFYTLIDVSLGSAGDTKFDGALRFGQADQRFNPVDRYIGAGFAASNFWADRPDDSIGVAMAYAHLGAPYRDAQSFAGAPTTPNEISWELVYSTNLTDWLAIRPGVQYVQHPGADLALADAWIVGLRFELANGVTFRQVARREAPAGDGTVASLRH